MPEPYTATKSEILCKHLYDKVRIVELATEYQIPAKQIKFPNGRSILTKFLKDVGHLSNERK